MDIVINSLTEAGKEEMRRMGEEMVDFVNHFSSIDPTFHVSTSSSHRTLQSCQAFFEGVEGRDMRCGGLEEDICKGKERDDLLRFYKVNEFFLNY